MGDPATSFSPSEGLGIVLDEHIRWIGRWHRAAFYRFGEADDLASAPAAFAAWVAATRAGELAHQPAIEKLVAVHEQMHRQAKLVLLKAATTGDPPTEAEYEAVAGRFEDFCAQLRRVERAFGAAASGLDPLTGLRSRRGMQEALEREMNRFRRAGQPFCIALCDIDKFKSVNDTYGHDIGDKVLAAFAAVISRGIRSFDEAFRMGGEEFLVCLKETTLAEGFRVIERLRIDLMNSRIPIGDGRELSITASFGLVQADHDTPIDDMVIRADKALYQAKHAGRNRVIRWGIDKPGAAPPPAAPTPVPPAPGRRRVNAH
ncbi:diguanylate cyclase [Azospirillum sp. RWY-5-1]|uniref:diguanylate cyclase n=1 Tax=Azospirillum oleiclasticum TaxID=2735135 RepID=A0ABX2TDA3_9PROT|nr:diguanylate cyclase [Azospirillum oleiclasticum]NYZ14695.1 diguanylate cyclase [Azospirillum oleiclasticum]NYZ22319.1 diguanylate cyclase [Azospirillum oleiclasticum]